MVDLMAEFESRQKPSKDRGGDRPKDKKKRRKTQPEKTVTIASTGKPTVLPPALTVDLSTKNEAGCSNPPPADLPAPSDKVPNPPPPPDKTNSEVVIPKADGADSCNIEITPSGVYHLKVSDEGGEAVDSPKPTGQQSPVVNIEDSPVSSQQAGQESTKNMKRAETTVDRLLRKAKSLKAKNRAAFRKPGAGNLQSKAREREVSEGLKTPSPKSGDQAPADVHIMSVSDIIKDFDSLKKQDELLGSFADLNAVDFPGEDATRVKKAALAEDATRIEKVAPAEDSVMTGLRLIRAKAEKVRSTGQAVAATA